MRRQLRFLQPIRDPPLLYAGNPNRTNVRRRSCLLAPRLWPLPLQTLHITPVLASIRRWLHGH